MTIRGIALGGKRRSGKDTVGDYLDEHYGFVQYAFGDKLKAEYHEQYPHIPWEPKDAKGYQLFGQLQRHALGEDIWINKCFDKINEHRVIATRYNITGEEVDFRPAITDMRQPNEFDAVTIRENYITIGVFAPDAVRKERMLANGEEFDEQSLNHETEQHVDHFPYHYTITNDSTLEGLYAQVDLIMFDLGVEKVTKGS
jgi:dephospho-CoA kinase